MPTSGFKPGDIAVTCKEVFPRLSRLTRLWLYSARDCVLPYASVKANLPEAFEYSLHEVR